jgi:hypothetical protein
METKSNLILINGLFSSEEAKEVLMNILASKVQFHELKNLRSIVTKDSEDQTSISRVRQLKETIEELKLILNEASENNMELSIKSNIEITLKKSNKDKVLL